VRNGRNQAITQVAGFAVSAYALSQTAFFSPILLVDPSFVDHFQRIQICTVQLEFMPASAASKKLDFHWANDQVGSVKADHFLGPGPHGLDGRLVDTTSLEAPELDKHACVQHLRGDRPHLQLRPPTSCRGISPHDLHDARCRRRRLQPGQRLSRPQKSGTLGRADAQRHQERHGFVQPLQPHQEWHVDVSYLKIAGTFYFLCSILDG
jgi:hypothetical protein